MHASPEHRLDLRRLILLLAVTAALLTLANTLYASYQVQRSLLIRQTLEANRAYAARLAESTESLLAMLRQQLASSAMRLSKQFDQPQQLAAETDRLIHQAGSFDATFILDADRTLLAISPTSPRRTGSTIETIAAREAVGKRLPTVSRPFVSVSGQRAVALSHPIHDVDGTYLGYVGGAIYLRQSGVLGVLLGEPAPQEDLDLYLIDRHGQILFHRDQTRVGELMHSNPARDAAIAGKNGSRQFVDAEAVDMLAGYAPVSSAGWSIVAQRPAATTRSELNGLMLGILRNASPVVVLTLLGLLWLSRLIARPLRQLAGNALQLDSQAAAEQIRAVSAWYYEAGQLKQALLSGLSQVSLKTGQPNLESISDPLTQLLNRRGMQLALEQWQLSGHPYSVIAIDIDHFRTVNDRFGHAAGDQLLRHLAQLMQQVARQADVLCRYGGEEFIMLLPGTSLVDACGVAERLRQCVADSPSPDGTTVTISLGVAHCPDSRNGCEAVLKKADQALCAAKYQGRNRVVTAGAA